MTSTRERFLSGELHRFHTQKFLKFQSQFCHKGTLVGGSENSPGRANKMMLLVLLNTVCHTLHFIQFPVSLNFVKVKD